MALVGMKRTLNIIGLPDTPCMEFGVKTHVGAEGGAYILGKRDRECSDHQHQPSPKSLFRILQRRSRCGSWCRWSVCGRHLGQGPMESCLPSKVSRRHRVPSRDSVSKRGPCRNMRWWDHEWKPSSPCKTRGKAPFTFSPQKQMCFICQVARFGL